MRISRTFEKNFKTGEFLFEKHSATYEESCDDLKLSDSVGVNLLSKHLYNLAKTDVLNAIKERQQELATSEMKKEFKKTEEKARVGKRGIMSLKEQNFKKTTFREGEEGFIKS